MTLGQSLLLSRVHVCLWENQTLTSAIPLASALLFQTCCNSSKSLWRALSSLSVPPGSPSSHCSPWKTAFLMEIWAHPRPGEGKGEDREVTGGSKMPVCKRSSFPHTGKPPLQHFHPAQLEARWLCGSDCNPCQCSSQHQHQKPSQHAGV